MAFTIIQRTRGGRHTLRRRTSVVHTARNELVRTSRPVHSKRQLRMRTACTLTYFVLIGCTHSQLGRVVREVRFINWTQRSDADDVAISLHVLRAEVQSSRVWRFVVGAELAVQSQQRRWDDGTRHPQLQPALSSAGTDEWVLSWRSNEPSDSSGDRRAVGSRFQVLEASFRQ